MKENSFSINVFLRDPRLMKYKAYVSVKVTFLKVMFVMVKLGAVDYTKKGVVN